MEKDASHSAKSSVSAFVLDCTRLAEKNRLLSILLIGVSVHGSLSRAGRIIAQNKSAVPLTSFGFANAFAGSNAKSISAIYCEALRQVVDAVDAGNREYTFINKGLFST